MRNALIAETSSCSAESLAFTLYVTGYKPFLISPGEDPLARAAELQPEIVLLDIGSKEFDGIALCRSIRQQSWGASTCVVVLVDRPGERYLKDAMDAGCDHYLLKPIRPDALGTLLSRLPETRQEATSKRVTPLGAATVRRLGARRLSPLHTQQQAGGLPLTVARAGTARVRGRRH